jgi:hypothetical protein
MWQIADATCSLWSLLPYKLSSITTVCTTFCFPTLGENCPSTTVIKLYIHLALVPPQTSHLLWITIERFDINFVFLAADVTVMISCSFNCTSSFVDYPIILPVSVMPGEFLILNVKTKDELDLRSMSMFMCYVCTTRREQVGVGFYAGGNLLVSEKCHDSVSTTSQARFKNFSLK